MIGPRRHIPGSFLTAAAVHIVAVLLLVIGYQTVPKSHTRAQPQIESIKAVAIIAPELEAPEPDKQAEREQQKQQLEQARMERDAEKKRVTDELKKAEEALAKRLRKEQDERKRKEAEKQRLAEVKRKEEEAKRQAEEERLRKEEEKRLAEEERKRQEEEQRRLAEAEVEAEKERKRKEQEQRKAEREKKRKQHIAQEKKAERQRLAAIMAQEEADLLAAEQAINDRKLKSLTDEYIAAITSKIERLWNRPASAKAGQSCVVNVKQTPGGLIESVQVERCTGDDAFRRSVESAVWKAEPLPSPPQEEVFDRELRFTFKPQDFG